jgi:hypothetical protein
MPAVLLRPTGLTRADIVAEEDDEEDEDEEALTRRYGVGAGAGAGTGGAGGLAEGEPHLVPVPGLPGTFLVADAATGTPVAVATATPRSAAGAARLAAATAGGVGGGGAAAGSSGEDHRAVEVQLPGGRTATVHFLPEPIVEGSTYSAGTAAAPGLGPRGGRAGAAAAAGGSARGVPTGAGPAAARGQEPSFASLAALQAALAQRDRADAGRRAREQALRDYIRQHGGPAAAFAGPGSAAAAAGHEEAEEGEEEPAAEGPDASVDAAKGHAHSMAAALMSTLAELGLAALQAAHPASALRGRRQRRL